MYHRGLGFEETFSDADSSSQPDGFFNALGTSINSSVARIDWASFDWHAWALAGLVGYIVLGKVIGGGRAVKEAGAVKVRRGKSRLRKARKAVAGFQPLAWLG